MTGEDEKEIKWSNELGIVMLAKPPADAEQEKYFLWEDEGTTIIGFNSDTLTGAVSVKIPSRCTVIRSDYAWNGNEDYRNFLTGIVSVELPDTITEIGYAAFHNFTKLESITIPNSVKVIGEKSFDRCKSLKGELVIPEGVEKIEKGAFSRCEELTSMEIPNTIKSIGAWLFQDCSKLTEIKFKGTINEWNNINKDNDWDYNAYITKITCTDGVIEL